MSNYMDPNFYGKGVNKDQQQITETPRRRVPLWFMLLYGLVPPIECVAAFFIGIFFHVPLAILLAIGCFLLWKARYVVGSFYIITGVLICMIPPITIFPIIGGFFIFVGVYYWYKGA